MRINLKGVGLLVLGIVLIALSGCTSSSSSAGEDTSVSGEAAAAAGGAMSGSGRNGTLAALFFMQPTTTRHAFFRDFLSFIPNAMASGTCPTYKTTGSGCAATGETMWLTYNDCSFTKSLAVWDGVQAITDSLGSTDPVCGTFPAPTASGNLIRQIVTASGSTTPSTATVTSAFGTTATIDDLSSNLNNFDSDTIATIINSGYGTQVDFGASGERTAADINHRIYTSGFDHSITGTLTVTETAGASTRVLTGSLTMYHNLLRIVGTSTFNSVTHEDGCCQPVSGTIQTTFAAGTNQAPTTAGSKYLGLTETLDLTGCGTGQFTSITGTTTNVTISRCF